MDKLGIKQDSLSCGFEEIYLHKDFKKWTRKNLEISRVQHLKKPSRLKLKQR
jgi:hypothetical protein